MDSHSTKERLYVRSIAYVPVARDAAVLRARIAVRPARRDSGAYLLVGVLILGALCFFGVLDAVGILI